MAQLSRIVLAWKALRELGLGRLWHFAVYQAILHSGYLSWSTRNSKDLTSDLPASTALSPVLVLPDQARLRDTLGEGGLAQLRLEAEEILSGKVRLFGGEPLPLNLSAPPPLEHWTLYERGKVNPLSEGIPDIKFLWEPGRFGWAYTLGRAFYLTGDERYAQGFWENADRFLEANPPFLGPHWMSAQEVALRLIALVFSAQLFSKSRHSTGERIGRLSQAVALHARRIPPTLAYAQAQNNNHLLSEAAGLFTAGKALPTHPQAKRWRELGWRWFHWGLQHQIDEDGTYIQQSTNYHRLMLHLALWMRLISDRNEEPTRERLAAATRWLLALIDAESGGVPNLGPNDGAYVFPLTVCPFADYRPVLQAAAAAFLGERPFQQGVWDEMASWFGQPDQRRAESEEIHRIYSPDSSLLTPHPSSTPPHVLHNDACASHAFLRLAHFHSRPGHADQLHLDLWWHGVNLAQDAGTYLYNADPPWDNPLSRTRVHNTLMVMEQEQMTRAGRFLWLDWAQAEAVTHARGDHGDWERLTARHDGYRRLGLVHQRSVTAFRDGRWLVEDTLLPYKIIQSSDFQTSRHVNVHWSLPDWEWEIAERSDSRIEIRILSPFGWISIRINTKLESQISYLQLIRAGELLTGSGEALPFLGWVSPTYGHKVPALSVNVEVTGTVPLSITTEWLLPQQSAVPES